MKYLFLAGLLTTFVSCKKTNTPSFWDGKDREDYSFFEGYSIYIRSMDKKGEPIVFVNFEEDSCNAPLILRRINGEMSFDNKVRKKSNCFLTDTSGVRELVDSFFVTGVAYLSVSTSGIVKINEKVIGAPPNLWYVSNDSLLHPNDKNYWIEVGDGWYIENR